ncbi:MAG: GNAT family N-acetyltransferase [Magnetococcales bacterium]|nr:GNAT family N-acetyltransferase [Magnetococcales bacterium]
MTPTWSRRRVSWRLQLGEFILAAPQRDMAVLDPPLATLLAGGLDAIPAPPDGDCLIRSLPVGDTPPPRLAWERGRIRYWAARFPRHYVILEGDFQDYLAGFSPKSRATLRRKVRRFRDHGQGDIRWRICAKPDEMAEFHRQARGLSALTYQERLLDAGLPGDDGFLRTLEDQARVGDVRGCLLYDGAQPIAYLLTPRVAGAWLYQHLGYDPAASRWSPGTVLQYLVLEALFEEGQGGWFDFTEGEGAHKRFFATHALDCGNLFLLRPTPANLLLVAAHVALEGLSRSLVAVLDRLGLKARLKRLFRGQERCNSRNSP